MVERRVDNKRFSWENKSKSRKREKRPRITFVKVRHKNNNTHLRDER